MGECGIGGDGAGPSNAVHPFLNMHTNGLLTKQSHEEIMKRVRAAVKKKNLELNSKIVSQRSKISKLQAQYEDTKLYLIQNQEVSSHFNLDELKKSIKDEEAKLVKLKLALEAEKEVILNYEEYLKLFRAIPVILSNIRYMKVMDELLRFFFLNFTIHPHNNRFLKRSKATCNIKEPWSGFLKHGNFGNGAGSGTLTHGLFHGKVALYQLSYTRMLCDIALMFLVLRADFKQDNFTFMISYYARATREIITDEKC